MSKTPKKAFFKSRRFLVTSSDLRTPTLFYPISETIGKLRRDVLFATLALSSLLGFALWVYFDLWYPHERIIMGGIIAAALLIGSQFSILQIDARGFPSRSFFGRTKTLRRVFHAITRAKAASFKSSGSAGEETDTSDD